MRRNIRIRQHDITDCGAACLASVAAYYRYHLPLARIRQYASTDQKGTNVLGMVEAAHKLGFQAKGVKGTAESLSQIPKPAIAHVVVPRSDLPAGAGATLHHFVVIYEVTKQYVRVMDPADGRLHRKRREAFAREWTGVLVLLLPDEQFRAGNEKTSVAGRFWRLIQPHRTVMTQALVGAGVYTLLGLSTSVYVQKIVDYVLVGGNRNLLNLMSVLMVILLLVQLFLGTAKSFFALRTGQRIDVQLILGYYQHLMGLPQQFFDTMRVGEILSRVNDAVKIRAFLNDTALNLLVNALIVVFSFALMFTYYWKLALGMLAVLPAYALIYWLVNRVNKRSLRQLMEHAADLEAQLVESLNAMATLKRFGLEAHANLQTETRFVRFLRSVGQSARTSILAGTATELVSRAATIGLLWSGAGLVMDQQLTPGELLSFYALVGYFTGPAASLISANRTVQDALIAADRLFELMDLEREEGANKVVLTPEMIGDVRFQDVTFRYGTRVSVFEGLTLTMARGRVTALVGESGSGKTTLLSLLQRIYPVTAGSIYLGDYDIRHLHTDSLRRLVSVVPQQIDLFAGHVIDNVAVGDFEPDMRKVLGICTMLGITGFIEQLPNGFHTYLGENGATLSGGQRQRLAIARALYRDPEVLILDEATASLDSASEQYVQRAVGWLRDRGKTVILIAHRLSTVMHADQIIVLERGKLVEQGTHRELLARQAAYHHLWAQQFPREGGLTFAPVEG